MADIREFCRIHGVELGKSKSRASSISEVDAACHCNTVAERDLDAFLRELEIAEFLAVSLDVAGDCLAGCRFELLA